MILKERDDFSLSMAKRIIGQMCQDSKRAVSKNLSKSMNDGEDSASNDMCLESGMFILGLYIL
jgi:hypothetical protein